jgi:hypothetical protein
MAIITIFISILQHGYIFTKRKQDDDEQVKNTIVLSHKDWKSATVSVSNCDVSASNVDSSTSKPEIPKSVKADKVKYRYYNESYIKYGFV